MAVQPIQMQVKTLKIDAATSGAANTIIAGVAGQIIYVWALFFTQASASTVKIFDGTTALTGVMTTAAGVPITLDAMADLHPLYVTTAGNDFKFTLGGAVQTSGTVWYSQQ